MMSRSVFIVLFLSFALFCIGCYTQLGTYESPLPGRQEAYNQRQGEQEPAELEPDVEVEADATDDGYYGRRKPGVDAHAPYDDQYYIWDAYSPQPYPPYPYYDFYAPYGYYYPDYGYYGHYYYPNYGYSPRRYNRGDIDNSRRRQSYRGRNSDRSSSERPKRSTEPEESNRPPAASSSESSDSRLRKMRREKRRH